MGDQILPACPFEELNADELEENVEVRWRIGSASRGTIINGEDTMPDQNLTVFGSLIRYREAVWKNGDEVLASTRQVVGDVLELFRPELEDGMICRWRKDGEFLPENYRMPDEDITLEALIYPGDHEHDWQETGTHEAPTCTEASSRHVVCSICLAEEDQEIPADAEARFCSRPGCGKAEYSYEITKPSGHQYTSDSRANDYELITDPDTGNAIDFNPGDAFLTCAVCYQHWDHNYPPVGMEPAWSNAEYDASSQLLTISLDAADVTADLTAKDLLAGAIGYAGTRGTKQYLPLQGTFAVSNGNEKLIESSGQTLFLDATFTPDSLDKYPMLYFTMMVTVPQE